MTTFGPTGYPDYQRIQNWDAPVFINDAATERTGSFNYGEFDVSKYGYLHALLSVQTESAIFVLRWRATKGGAILGERSIPLSGAGGARSIQARIPNLGPWLEVEAKPPLGATKWRSSTKVLPTNRFSATEVLPPRSELFGGFENVLGAGSIATVYPQMFAGPVGILTLAGAQPFEFSAEVNVEGELWRPFWVRAQAAKASTWGTAIAPLGSWRVKVFNAGAAEGVWTMSIQAGTSGSS